MFTGIIRGVGVVLRVERGKEVRVLFSAGGLELQVADSISVSGCCLTVESLEPEGFVAALSSETLARTSFGSRLAEGQKVNLEQALLVSDRLGGHIVQGHVDCTGRVVSLVEEGEGAILTLTPDEERYLRYCTEKGSVAVDGVSLTLTGAGNGLLSIALVPYTLENTTLGELGPGDPLNLEFDVIAKYVESLSAPLRR